VDFFLFCLFSDTIHRTFLTHHVKEKQHLCPDLSTKVNVQILSIHMEEHTTVRIQTKYDTLPFFRFQHNHFECVFRSAILKLETPSVTGDIGRVRQTYRLHSQSHITTNHAQPILSKWVVSTKTN
jgi:hypothetical protein